MNRSTGRPSYWIVLVPLLLGVGTCAGSFYSLMNKIEGMPRVKVPGTGRVHLSTGEHVGYIEHKSVVNGASLSGSPNVTCTMKSASTGDPVLISGSGGSTSYTFGSYAGESFMTVNIPSTGDYVIMCKGSGTGAVAFGSGIGMLIGVAVGGGLLGFGVAGFLFWRIRKKRRYG